MNAITPLHAFDLAADRFDRVVAEAFAADDASRHVRDRLIDGVGAGRYDPMLLRARSGIAALPDAVNRRAALNVIDFAFEAIVLANMSTEQAVGYLGAVENTLTIREASGLDGPGPLWVDTVHHVCVFSVLFQLAVLLGRNLGFTQVILLHQGQRSEPRLRILANLLRQVHGIAALPVPLHGNWFAGLARIATPGTVILYLTDMPPEAFPRSGRRRARSRLVLSHEAGPGVPVETVCGSQSFARRLRARRILLDYPSTDSMVIRPLDVQEGTRQATLCRCPLQDWMLWPLLGGTTPSATGGDEEAVPT